MSQIFLAPPQTQVAFAHALQEIRNKYFQEALSAAVATLNISDIDGELYNFANADDIKILASHGMRGESLFAVPCILKASPYLLGYYRLLLGHSQKGFYTSASGIAMFKAMEEKGTLTVKQEDFLSELCKALNSNASSMLQQLSCAMVSTSFFDQLTLLTLGPQLRGGANVQRGSSAIKEVFGVIYKIVEKYIITANERCIELKNTSGRKILIQFSSDPDIVMKEELAPKRFKSLTAIEVKGGQDYSNIHNRVGEAEKSHQKAKKAGYIECWTVVNVDRIDMAMAHRESPATSRFYRISELLKIGSAEHQDFVMQVISTIGIS